MTSRRNFGNTDYEPFLHFEPRTLLCREVSSKMAPKPSSSPDAVTPPRRPSPTYRHTPNPPHPVAPSHLGRTQYHAAHERWFRSAYYGDGW
jgi:hypothetical protein